MWVVNRMYSDAVADKEEKRHQRALRIVKRLRLMDDDFMKRCLRDNPAAVACILLNIPGLMSPPVRKTETAIPEKKILQIPDIGNRLDL